MNLIAITQTVIALAIIALILLQQGGSDMSGFLGGGGSDGGFYQKRRGIQKTFFYATVILIIIFALLSIIIFLSAEPITTSTPNSALKESSDLELNPDTQSIDQENPSDSPVNDSPTQNLDFEL
jgi:protein translocase SecG subunit